MSDHDFWLSDAQSARLQPLLPNKVRGVPRVDDRKVISGIMWRDAPACYGPHKTLYNRFVRLEQGRGVRAASHRCQPAEKGAFPRQIGRTRGGLDSKLHAVCDGECHLPCRHDHLLVMSPETDEKGPIESLKGQSFWGKEGDPVLNSFHISTCFSETEPISFSK